MNNSYLINQIKTNLNSSLLNSTIDNISGTGSNPYSFMSNATAINQPSKMWTMLEIFDLRLSAMYIPLMFMVRYFLESLSAGILKTTLHFFRPERAYRINKAKESAANTIKLTKKLIEQNKESLTSPTSAITSEDTLNKMKMLNLAQKTVHHISKYQSTYPTQMDESQIAAFRTKENTFTKLLTTITLLPMKIWRMLSISSYTMLDKTSLTKPVLSDIDQALAPNGEMLLCACALAKTSVMGRLISANNTTIGMISDIIFGYLAINTLIGVVAVALSSTLTLLTIPLHCLNTVFSSAYRQNSFISNYLSDLDAQSTLMEEHNQKLLQEIEQQEHEDATTPNNTINQAQASNTPINDVQSHAVARA